MNRPKEPLFACQSLACKTKRNGEQHFVNADDVRWIEHKRRSLPVCREAFDRWNDFPGASHPRRDDQAHQQAA